MFGPKICAECWHVGSEKEVTQGSFLIEVFLWLFFLLPGILYSSWRQSSRRKCCPVCGGHMIPASSPKGRAIVEAHFRDEG